MTTYEQRVRDLCIEAKNAPYSKIVKNLVAMWVYDNFFEYEEEEKMRTATMSVGREDILLVIGYVENLKDVLDTRRFDKDFIFLGCMSLALRDWKDDLHRTNSILANTPEI